VLTLEEIEARDAPGDETVPAPVSTRPRYVSLDEIEARSAPSHNLNTFTLDEIEALAPPPTRMHDVTEQQQLMLDAAAQETSRPLRPYKRLDAASETGLRDKNPVERTLDRFGRTPASIRNLPGPPPLRRAIGKFGTTNGVEIGVADFTPFVSMLLAIDDVKRDEAYKAAGLDVSDFQSYSNKFAVGAGALTLGVGAGFVKASAKGGKMISGGVAKIYRDNAQQFTNRFYDTFGYKLAPLGKVPEKDEYLSLRYRTLGKISAIDDVTKHVARVFNNASEADQKAAYEFLTTKDALPAGIESRKVRVAAWQTKQTIDKIGRELVKRGKLSEEVYEANRGSYLPRVYLKHLLERGDGAQGTAGKKLSDQGYLRSRKYIPEDVRRIILGEITDPGYVASKGIAVPSHDLVMDTFLQKISKKPEWVNPTTVVEWNGRNVSTRWMYDESTRLKAQASYMDEAEQADVLLLADEMDELIKQAEAPLEKVARGEAAIDVPHIDYKIIPDNPRYGALRGMEVRKEIANDIEGAVGFVTDADSLVGKIYHKSVRANQLWKLSKVALNPPTQVRNFISNAILMNLGGVPLHAVPKNVYGAIRDMQTGGNAWKVAQKYGVTSTTFSHNELYRVEEDMLQMLNKSKSPLDTVKYMAGSVGNKAGEIYQLSESVFKTAMIRHLLSKGVGEEKAALEAHKALFDYSLIPDAVRKARSAPLGSPFITFMYKSTGQMAEIAVKHPERYLPYMVMNTAMAKMIEEQYDVTQKDVDALRKALPQWTHNKSSMYALPVLDEDRRIQFVDLGYIMPWGQLAEAIGTVADGDIRGLLKDTGFFGGPIPQVLSAIQTNIDPYTERPIANKADPPAVQMADITRYMWRMAAPTWLTDIGLAGKLYDHYRSDVNRYGDPSPTLTQAALRGVGINIYPVEPHQTRSLNITKKEREIADVMSRLDWKLRDQTLDEDAREAVRVQYMEHYDKLVSSFQEYLDKSEVHENFSPPEGE